MRWSYEELPQLPVIAAGSLLDFALEDHSFSMPVGRIRYLYLESLSFEEFLETNGKSIFQHTANYQLISLPLYLAGQIHRLLETVTAKSQTTR